MEFCWREYCISLKACCVKMNEELFIFLSRYTIYEIVPNPLNYFCVVTDFILCDESYAIMNDECFNVTELSLC